MAKTIIAGEAVVITSTLKLEDIQLVEKYQPEALAIKDEEGVPVFAIGTTVCSGSIGTYGASFGRADEQGFASMTLVPGPAQTDGRDLKTYVVEELGGALANIGKLEASLPAVVGEINAQKAAIAASITVL